MLEMRGVVKKYGRTEALSGVSLRVEEGDGYGFLGHNGAGKTTALRIALGLVRPDAGTVLVDGFDAARFPREARARQGGLIETPGFYPYLSARDNLRALARLRGFDRRGATREAGRLLDLAGLAAAADRKVGGFSQGMRQRLGIAAAMAGDPPLLLLDEPVNGLDPEGIEEFRRLVLHLRHDRRRTVLLSSHLLAELAGVTNRIGILRQGRLVLEGATADLLAGDGGRWLLRTDDPAAARAVLAGLGAQPAAPDVAASDPRAADAVPFDTGAVPSPAVARAVVGRGLELRELSPRPRTLTEIYLGAARGELPAPPPAPAPATAPPPAARLAPPGPLRAAVRHEAGRLLRSGPIALLLLPALLAALSVLEQWHAARQHLAEVAAGTLASQSLVTAFEAAAAAVRFALPFLLLAAAGLASQSLAGEYAGGTLRNLLLTPAGRTRLAIGKLFGLCAAALLAFAALSGAALAASALLFDFTDVVEVLEIRTAKPWVIAEAAALRGPFAAMFPQLALPLLAVTALGFLAGAAARRATTALALAAGLLLAFEMLRGVAGDLAPWLVFSHYPSPFGDTSPAARVLSMIRAPNDIPAGFPETVVLAPALWFAAAAALPVLVLGRRSVP
ncbi:MAG: ABC transporter ATP-binding protein [Planctomycetes bacterium]|jgi:ABC-2 type transport system ATP-binding protein|nr:ABC transporter ATP-binding protein [Planctomycetota bacterium]